MATNGTYVIEGSKGTPVPSGKRRFARGRVVLWTAFGVLGVVVLICAIEAVLPAGHVGFYLDELNAAGGKAELIRRLGPPQEVRHMELGKIDPDQASLDKRAFSATLVRLGLTRRVEYLRWARPHRPGFELVFGLVDQETGSVLQLTICPHAYSLPVVRPWDLTFLTPRPGEPLEIYGPRD